MQNLDSNEPSSDALRAYPPVMPLRHKKALSGDSLPMSGGSNYDLFLPHQRSRDGLCRPDKSLKPGLWRRRRDDGTPWAQKGDTAAHPADGETAGAAAPAPLWRGEEKLRRDRPFRDPRA